MKIIAIVQARMGSNRVPEKVMKPICGMPMIGIILNRLSKSKYLDEIILATSELAENDILDSYITKLGFEVFRGSEEDVLDRYYQVSKLHNADAVVRITGDCPLIDHEVVDSVIELFKSSRADYASNVYPPTFPDGLDVEVFLFSTLEIAWKNAKSDIDREHVTSYISQSSQFKMVNYSNKVDHSDKRWTVDENNDLKLVEYIYEHFNPRKDFSWLEVIDLATKNPAMFSINKHIPRNQGADIGTGQKLWKRAKEIIPGGNMLLSKRAEMFLPELWPAYYSKAKGCRVWDMDGNEFIDAGIMGVGTNLLGYGNPEVDDAVRQVIDNGNMSTLNCFEEVYLAEKLLELHPWAQMARFARTGGEANAISIRIARAASKKRKVAFCGYHGWHDWYLSANLANEKALSDHLLPGLKPNGVPKELGNSIYPFYYNQYEELEKLVDQYDIGIIKMEVSRNEKPKNNFLEKVRKLATNKGIILIFDECTSGFRQSFGGLHKYYDVEPDIAVFGKTLGNGYAITSVIGKREIMEYAQSSFISSTFWTERIGPSAALKTLQVMEEKCSWDTVTDIGHKIAKEWRLLAKKHGLNINVIDSVPALLGFTFDSDNMPLYKTLITQEMYEKGYLASNSFYVCTEHHDEIVESYLENLDRVFELIAKCEDGMDVLSLLKGPVCHENFKRLN